MRIRTFRYEDIHALVPLQQLAAQADGVERLYDLASWPNDSELNAGYTLVQVLQDETGYHLLCQGAVHPAQRHRGAGRALLICALNRARLLAEEFEFEAEQAGIPVYFEALLPARNPASARLAAKCEMLLVSETASSSMQLYRADL